MVSMHYDRDSDRLLCLAAQTVHTISAGIQMEHYEESHRGKMFMEFNTLTGRIL